jgi:hypothetical protein
MPGGAGAEVVTTEAAEAWLAAFWEPEWKTPVPKRIATTIITRTSAETPITMGLFCESLKKSFISVPSVNKSSLARLFMAVNLGYNIIMR